jgi:hypothetical protein
VHKLFAVVAAAGALAVSSPVVAFGANPHGPGQTGQPGQSCQTIGVYPGNGHAQTSPGSPFNEPSGSNPGGIGGQHYNSTNSQYDVACFQASQH